MQTENYTLTKLIASEGKVFDWANLNEHIHEEENPETGEKETIQEHLYTKVIYLGKGDSVDNYVEVNAPVKED